MATLEQALEIAAVEAQIALVTAELARLQERRKQLYAGTGVEVDGTEAIEVAVKGKPVAVAVVEAVAEVGG